MASRSKRSNAVLDRPNHFAPPDDPFRAMSDSGLVSRFAVAQHSKPQLEGFFVKLNKAFKAAFGTIDDSNKTTAQGSAEFAAPSIATLTLWQLRYERRQMIKDTNVQYLTDPRCFTAVNMYAKEAVRGGCSIDVDPELSGKRFEKANEIAERIQNIVNPVVESWARMTLVDGDTFLQAFIADEQVVGCKRMPTASMERCSNDMDEFTDPLNAYAQVDTLTNSEVATFPEAIMHQIRWNHIDGTRYGIPQIAAARRAWRLLEMMEESQVRRRMGRASQKILWIIGNKESPGQQTDIDNFRQNNAMVNGARQAMDPNEVNRDYFVNGNGDAKILEGDSNIANIDDIKYWANFLTSAGYPTPPALYNLLPENINRDILEDQRAEWLKSTKSLTDVISAAVKWLFELALLAEGILPETIAFTIHFSSSNLETVNEIVERLVKLYQLSVGTGKEWIWTPMITRQTLLQELSDYFDIPDVNEYMAQLDDEVAGHHNSAMTKESDRKTLDQQFAPNDGEGGAPSKAVDKKDKNEDNGEKPSSAGSNKKPASIGKLKDADLGESGRKGTNSPTRFGTVAAPWNEEYGMPQSGELDDGKGKK